MDCFFINLDSAVQRRERLLASFGKYASSDWSLKRWPATTVREVVQSQSAGSLRDSEKACYLSHRNAVAQHADSRAPFMVLEDDTTWGPSTCKAVDGYLTQAGAAQWDLIFTDICVPNTSTMIELIRLRRDLEQRRSIHLLELSKTPFAAAAAYIVMPGAAQKVLQVLDTQAAMDVPVDIVLRKAIYQGRLKACCFFPFLTTLSDESEASQVQTADTLSADLVWNTFRKMVWMDRNLAEVKPLLARIEADLLDDDARLFASLLAAQASAKFVSK